MAEPSKKYKILLAEDNPGDVYLVKEALKERKLDCEIYSVDDGEKAIEFIESAGSPDRPVVDLVMLDLNLPRRTGDEVLVVLRQSPVLKNTPAIVLTSSQSPHDRSNLKNLGADVFFHKPTGLDEFMELGKVVEELLQLP